MGGRKIKSAMVKICLLFPLFLLGFYEQGISQVWKEIGRGLYVGEFKADVYKFKKSISGDSTITIVKVNPRYYSFKLLTYKETGNFLTAREWAEKYNLTAVINAGMFLPDYRNVGYMRNYNNIINSNIVQNYNAFIVFNPKVPTIPAIQIIDRQYQDYKKLIVNYNTVIQNLRMIDIHRKNRWSQSKRIWSIAAFGMDKNGNALLIHCRSPYSVHDFINILLKLPINIRNAAYLEGGPEASLYLKAGDVEIERFGSYEIGFYESNDNPHFWPIPNVIGVVKKEGR